LQITVSSVTSDKQTGRQAGRQTDTKRHPTGRHADKQADRKVDTQTDRQADRWDGQGRHVRWAGRQTGRWKDKQTDVGEKIPHNCKKAIFAIG
jgi:hypothetical protein